MPTSKLDTRTWVAIGSLAIATIGGISTVLGFLWSLHSRVAVLEADADMAIRIENLENQLLPVLVEYQVRERLKEEGLDPWAPTRDRDPELYEEADDWAQEQIALPKGGG